MSKLTEIRVDFLKQFNHYVWNVLQDEEIIDYWLTEGIPDYFNYEDLVEIAEDDEEWRFICEVFGHCCKMADDIV